MIITYNRYRLVFSWLNEYKVTVKSSAFFVKEKVRELTEGFILWPEKLSE